jgi:uncharacterized tellurite resistance protein B-like protein
MSMLSYVYFGTNDLSRAVGFYNATLAPLGLERVVTNDAEWDRTAAGWGLYEEGGLRELAFWIGIPFNREPASVGNGSMVAFRALSWKAVDDPVAAAVILMMAVASEEHPLTQTAEAVIRKEVAKTIGIADPTEVMVFGKWVASHVEDANNVSLRYAKLWMRDLSESEREDLVQMVRRVAAADGEVSARQQLKIAKLRERLALK